MKRSATANWKGGLKAGKGTFSSASGTFSNVPYDFAQRFETGAGTSPEELIAAAHASCFAMALSAELEKVGLPPENVDAQGDRVARQGRDGFAVTTSHLEVTVKLANPDKSKFERAAEAAKRRLSDLQAHLERQDHARRAAWPSRQLGFGRSGQVPADAEVAQRRAVVARQVVEAGGVVVRVGVAPVRVDGARVGLERRGVAPLVLERHAQVEAAPSASPGRMVERAPVVRLGGRQVAALVQDAPQVDVRVGVLGRLHQDLAVARLGLHRIGLVDVAADLVDLLGGSAAARRRRRRRRAGRAGARSMRQRRFGGVGARGGVERQQHLARLDLPAGVPLLHDDRRSLGAELHAGQRARLGQLRPQLLSARRTRCGGMRWLTSPSALRSSKRS